MSEHNDKTEQDRRAFLCKGLGLVGLTLAPGVFLYNIAQARPAEQAASSAIRWGMLVDTNKCKPGCNDCVTACGTENGWKDDPGRAETRVQWMRKVTLKDRQTGRQTSLPMMCQHCAEPPCVDVCPTGASFKRADGIVLVDKHACIGCRFCMMACPYKARSFVHEPLHNQKPYAPRGKGTVESCTMCVHRIDRDRPPACVEACPEGAMVFGNMNDPQSDIATRLAQYPSTQIRADLRLNLGVRYEGI